MQKIVFSSDQLPAHLSEKARFSAWRDMWTAQIGAAEMSHDNDRKFYTRAEVVPIGETRAIQFATTTSYWGRLRQHIKSDEREEFTICFNRSSTPQSLRRGQHETTLKRGSVLVQMTAMPSETYIGGEISWVGAVVPRTQILALVPDAEQKVMRLLEPHAPVVRHLEHYIDFLLSAHEVGEDARSAEHASALLVDLMALAFGAKGDAAEMAAARGLRMARLHDALAIIRTRFADPAFSTDDVAKNLGISRRYVNVLLSESGTGFTERVMELRLQKARAMLADPARNRFKISDIAFDCGFNEIAYFNRSFRARFGLSPTQCRGG